MRSTPPRYNYRLPPLIGAGTKGSTIEQSTVTATELRHGIRELDLSGRAVCVHASLRSFGTVDGGADAVLDALLAEGCTVMVPSFSDSFSVVPPAELLLQRNGWDAASAQATGSLDRVYDPASNDIDRDMGAIPAALVARPSRARGDHPLDSFAAIGRLADDLVAEQQPLDVYAPFRALIEHGGVVLQMGVGLARMTLLHLAEHQAGRALFRRWARGCRARYIECEIGSCSNGFDAFEPILAPLVRETHVGASRWRAFDPGAVVSAASDAIRANPAITHCPDPGCVRCSDAIAGGPLLT